MLPSSEQKLAEISQPGYLFWLEVVCKENVCSDSMGYNDCDFYNLQEKNLWSCLDVEGFCLQLWFYRRLSEIWMLVRDTTCWP